MKSYPGATLLLSSRNNRDLAWLGLLPRNRNLFIVCFVIETLLFDEHYRKRFFHVLVDRKYVLIDGGLSSERKITTDITKQRLERLIDY